MLTKKIFVKNDNVFYRLPAYFRKSGYDCSLNNETLVAYPEYKKDIYSFWIFKLLLTKGWSNLLLLDKVIVYKKSNAIILSIKINKVSFVIVSVMSFLFSLIVCNELIEISRAVVIGAFFVGSSTWILLMLFLLKVKIVDDVMKIIKEDSL